jgi:hypothetical protein
MRVAFRRFNQNFSPTFFVDDVAHAPLRAASPLMATPSFATTVHAPAGVETSLSRHGTHQYMRQADTPRVRNAG